MDAATGGRDDELQAALVNGGVDGGRDATREGRDSWQEVNRVAWSDLRRLTQLWKEHRLIAYLGLVPAGAGTSTPSELVLGLTPHHRTTPLS
jgi:hypothetical protein